MHGFGDGFDPAVAMELGKKHGNMWVAARVIMVSLVLISLSMPSLNFTFRAM